MGKKLLMTNVVYGDIYSDLFLNQHLKSMMDESNIPAVKDRFQYLVFSDRDTFPKILEHPNFLKMQEVLGKENVELNEIGWPKDQPMDRFGARYSIIMGMFKESVKKALNRGSLLSAIVADLVVAREFLPRIFAHIDAGYDSVFVLPPRGALESIGPELDKYPRAMHADDLWRLIYNNLHPLWLSCHVRPEGMFTKLPFSLLWNSMQGGILARSFSVTPVILTPDEKMIEGRGMIDGEIPALCKNPYWCRDWTDAPIVGVEPLFCYYPPWGPHTAKAEWVLQWSRQCLHPTQLHLLKEKLYYPSKEMAEVSEELEKASDKFVEVVLT